MAAVLMTMMKRDVRVRGGVLMSAVLVASLSGCMKVENPPPSADEVLLYLRSYYTGGEVRVLWPAGQEYVKNVLTAVSDFEGSISTGSDLLTLEALPPLDSSKWEKERQLREQLDSLKEWDSEESRKTRAEKWAAIDEAVKAVPDGLNMTLEDEEAFITKARAAALEHLWFLLASEPMDDLESIVKKAGANVPGFQKLIEGCLARESGSPGMVDEVEPIWRELNTRLTTNTEELKGRLARMAEAARAEKEMLNQEKDLLKLAKRAADGGTLTDEEAELVKDFEYDPERREVVMFLLHNRQTMVAAADKKISRMDQLIKQNKKALEKMDEAAAESEENP